ncbi:hypothetical protein AWENTII_007424 [Aspergillus wentii]
MRLIYAHSIKDRLDIREFHDHNVPAYAILSHRWEQDEATFQEVRDNSAEHKEGYQKIKAFCRKAIAVGFDWIWVDTCCIDKTSSSELSEAINSMYRWYQEASVCYAYLHDVKEEADIPKSAWFTRGFTLQELIAPSMLILLDYRWGELGSKESLKETISQVTQIPIGILSGKDDLESISVAQRMSWAAKRSTSRLEDQAYCLMGLFGINMPLIYGEGRMAFIRLQEEIMKVSEDHSLFAWESDELNTSGLLATSPAAFQNSADVIVKNDSSLASKHAWTVNNKGIHVKLPFIGLGCQGLGLAVLHCTRIGNESQWLAIYLRDMNLTMESFQRTWSETFELIDLQRLRPVQFPLRRICVQQRRLAMSGRQMDPQKSSLRDSSQRPPAGAEFFRMLQSKPVAEAGPSDINRLDQNGRSHLSHLAEEGDPQKVLSMLSVKNIEVNSEDKSGRTPLSYAAQAGNVIVVWLLLTKRGSKSDSKDFSGRTPLSLAAERGHSEVVWLLLTQADVGAYTTDNSGLTPLSYAAKGGHESLLRMYLARGNFKDHLIDGSGRTPLSHAASNGQEGILSLLLKRSDIETDMRDTDGRTPLVSAVQAGYVSIVELLLDRDADIDAQDNGGRTAMWHAVRNRHEAMIQLLISHGANINSKGGKRGTAVRLPTPGTKQDHLIRLLAANGADIEQNDESGKGIVHWAAKEQDEEIVKLLLSHVVDLHSPDSSGKTPLFWAAENNREDIVRLLLAHDGNTESKDGYRTPLVVAVKNGHYRIAQLLLAHGANPNLTDHFGSTLLRWAMEHAQENMFLLLIAHGADTNKGDRLGKNALCWAVEVGNESFVKHLLNHGADPDSRNIKGDPLIFVAIYKSQDVIVRLLIMHGADLEAKNTDGKTPIQYAKRLGYSLGAYGKRHKGIRFTGMELI